MKITNIKINKFRGIENVSIDIHEMLNFIVSDNNVGKTRILEAINQFYVGKEEADIEITYFLDNTDKDKIVETVNEIDSIIDNTIVIHYNNKKYYYCVQKVTFTGTKVKSYYNIVLFFNLDLPVLGQLFTFRATGSTTELDATYDQDLFGV